MHKYSYTIEKTGISQETEARLRYVLGLAELTTILAAL
jgi:hypothetical protein